MLVLLIACRRTPSPQGSIEEFTLASTSPREQNLKVYVYRHMHVPITKCTVVICGHTSFQAVVDLDQAIMIPSLVHPMCVVCCLYCRYILLMHELLLVLCRLLSRHQKAKELRPILAMWVLVWVH